MESLPLNFTILKSPVNILIVLLVSTLGMMALAAIFPAPSA